MSLEATMIIVDNSDYARNGDFLPNRFQAQADALNFICMSKKRAHTENTLGLVTLANSAVICTLTSDNGKLYSKMAQIKPDGVSNLSVAIRIANLVLKHRLNRAQRTRIVCFVGSPLTGSGGESLQSLAKLAKRLRKEKVTLDIINFGEDFENLTLLTNFVSLLNGGELTTTTANPGESGGEATATVTAPPLPADSAGGSGSAATNLSRLITIPAGTNLQESLRRSTMAMNAGGEEDGASGGIGGAGGLGLGGGFDASGLGGAADFGGEEIDDPDLLFALRASMEEQRMRLEREAAATAANQGGASGATATGATATGTANQSGASGATNPEEAKLSAAMATDEAAGSGGAAASSNSANAATSSAASSSAAATIAAVNFAAMTEEEQIAYALKMSLEQMQDDDEEENLQQDKNAQNQKNNDNVSAKEDEGEEDLGEVDLDLDVVNNPELIESVLQTLPGVDTDSVEVQSALSSLRRQQDKDKKKDDKQEEEDDDDKMQH